jgi:hypothetical protein
MLLGTIENSNQDRAAIDDEHLPRAVALPHQVEVGFGDLGRVANVADRQPFRRLLIERPAICFSHICPQWRSHHAGRDDVDANGCKFDRQRARQSLHRGANARTERPARMRALPGDA